MKAPKTEIVEEKVLIATRRPPGDRWSLVDDTTNRVYESIVDTLEAYMNKTNFMGHYRLEPLNSKLYAISAEEVTIKPDPIRTYNLYGEYGEK